MSIDMKILVWSVITMVFIGLETVMVNIFNDPKFYGEAAGSIIFLLLLLFIYLRCTYWLFLKGNHANTEQK